MSMLSPLRTDTVSSDVLGTYSVLSDVLVGNMSAEREVRLFLPRSSFSSLDRPVSKVPSMVLISLLPLKR